MRGHSDNPQQWQASSKSPYPSVGYQDSRSSTFGAAHFGQHCVSNDSAITRTPYRTFCAIPITFLVTAKQGMEAASSA